METHQLQVLSGRFLARDAPRRLRDACATLGCKVAIFQPFALNIRLVAFWYGRLHVLADSAIFLPSQPHLDVVLVLSCLTAVGGGKNVDDPSKSAMFQHKPGAILFVCYQIFLV